MSTDKQLAQRLGDKFAELLAQALQPKELETVRARNAAETDPGVCHSHDFCDANEVMAEAFEEVVGREIDTDDDEDSSLWAAAWKHAKTAHLTEPRPTVDELLDRRGMLQRALFNATERVKEGLFAPNDAYGGAIAYISGFIRSDDPTTAAALLTLREACEARRGKA